MKLYKVGGCVRDELLGIKSKDIDFTFVLDDLAQTVEQGFKTMEQYLIDEGYKIYQTRADMYTIRAKFPVNHQYSGLDADFVMARKEIGYTEDSRDPILQLGTLEDDLIRRDFTINAMAIGHDGVLIDLFNGQKHLKDKVLITPLPAEITFLDDPLRMLRALRFSITKELHISNLLWIAMTNKQVLEKMAKTVSIDRVRDEISKMMKYDTIKSLRLLNEVDRKLPGFLELVISKGLWLKPTNEAKI